MYISRIADDSREQMTGGHLKETADHACIIGSKFHASMLAFVAAILHDMGKLYYDFISYLRLSALHRNEPGKAPRKGSVVHSTQGAIYVYDSRMNERDLPLSIAAEAIAACIAGHHGMLMDGISIQGVTPLLDKLSINKEELHYDDIVSAFLNEGILNASIEDLLSGCRDEIIHLIQVCKTKNLNIGFMVHMLVKCVFSCLIDADRYNAYCFDTKTSFFEPVLSVPWETLARRLEAHLSKFSMSTEIDRIRHHISGQCFNAAALPRGVYRLAVPTGGGKTLSSLRFALNHAKEQEMEHIIYVIPYLSVLEQTAKEIKKALAYRDDDDFILEHHSNLLLPEDENKAQERRLLTDRWSQPIIITTMVQFLETLFSEKSAKLRKLHNMANAVIIFDEIQFIPIKCVHLFNEAVNYLHNFGNSTVLLCTATQPLLDKVQKPLYLSSPPSLISDTSEAFRALKRTCIVDSTKLEGYTIESLRDFLLEKFNSDYAVKNCLVILNTKKDASNLFRCIRSYLTDYPRLEIKLVHLSTSMCPKHRLDVIDSLQEGEGNRRSLKKERILCISTQLIEAGVDISFDCVVRARAGLDSIAQAAGRCNRNGENPDGRNVYIINLAEEDLSKLPDIQCGSSIAARILSENHEDLLSNNVMNRYYEEYFFNRKNEMDYLLERNANLYDLLSLNKVGYGAYINSGGKTPPALRQAFRTAGDNFCVIERNTLVVLVPYQRGEALIQEYTKASLKEKTRLLHEMERYSVSLYPYQRKMLENEQALFFLEDDVIVLNGDYYHPDLGVVFTGDMKFMEY